MFALPISKPRFNTLFFIKIALKLSNFCKKIQNFRALGAPPLEPRASSDWGLRSQTPQTGPHSEILATRLITHRHPNFPKSSPPTKLF